MYESVQARTRGDSSCYPAVETGDMTFQDRPQRTETMTVDGGLQESLESLRRLVNTVPGMSWVSGQVSQYRVFNGPWMRFTGQTMDQELGIDWTEGVHPDDLASYLEVYYSAFDARRDFTVEYRLRRGDGVYRWIFETGVPLPVSDGGFAGYIGSCIDITERKEMEEALRRREERLLAFL